MPVKVRDISNDLDTKLFLWLLKPGTKDLVVFSRQFSVMISAGVPVVESLKVMIDQTQNLYLQKMIMEITAEEVVGKKRPSLRVPFVVRRISRAWVSTVTRAPKVA